jgi:DNA-directed RNA polymerase specialized sigma24 family protein
MGEQALWDRWTRSRDPRAFDALARRLERFAFNFARRVTGHDADAEDLAQEALLDLAEAGPSKPAAVSVRAFVGRRIVLGARMLKRAALTRARHEQAAAREGAEGPGEEGADARDALALLDEEDRRPRGCACTVRWRRCGNGSARRRWP